MKIFTVWIRNFDPDTLIIWLTDFCASMFQNFLQDDVVTHDIIMMMLMTLISSMFNLKNFAQSVP